MSGWFGTGPAGLLLSVLLVLVLVLLSAVVGPGEGHPATGARLGLRRPPPEVVDIVGAVGLLVRDFGWLAVGEGRGAALKRILEVDVLLEQNCCIINESF